MFFHLLLTTNCDLRCRYCYGKSCDDIDTEFGDFKIDYNIPKEINYDINLLEKFIKKDPESVLIFYGGEPTLCIDKMEEIMDKIKAKQFNIQTNGVNLNQLDPEYIKNLTTIFISIDGKEELTDYYRGKDVFNRAINNIKATIKNGFSGEIIARMTLMEETDIYENVRWLLSNPSYSFSSIHWQLDAGFWKSDFKKRNFKEWVEKNYNPKLRKLVDYWVEVMEKEEKVLKLYPFLGVMQSLLIKEDSYLRCGSGWANYSIQTDGHLIPCPAMSGMKDYYLGHIKDTNPLNLKQVHVGKPCTNCQIFRKCGGRCLYANITKQWNSEEYNLVCKTVKNLLESLEKYLPRVKTLISQGKIKLSNFRHIKYNSCEIIP